MHALIVDADLNDPAHVKLRSASSVYEIYLFKIDLLAP